MKKCVVQRRKVEGVIACKKILRVNACSIRKINQVRNEVVRNLCDVKKSLCVNIKKNLLGWYRDVCCKNEKNEVSEES